MASAPVSDFILRRDAAISSSMAREMLSRLVEAMSRQMSAGLDASRVVSRSPRPASASPSLARAFTDDVHQRAGHELRQMADVGHGRDRALPGS